MNEFSRTAAASCPGRPGQACELGPPQSYPDRSGLVENVSIVRCHHCGIGITNPPLHDVAFLYEGRESQDFQPLATGPARAIKTIAFHREARKLLRQIGIHPRRILDFGCGSGLFTRCLGDLLPSKAVVGSDFHADPPVELADRLYVPNDQLSGERGTFDLVLAMHVIEHDDDPIELLRSIKTLGGKDCTFVFEVPNVDCVWARIFGQSWDAWYLPFHRTHFSRQSLRGLLERSGFEIIRMVDATIPSLGRSLANAMGKENTLGFLLAGAILHPIQWIVEHSARSPTALRVIARASN
jgi:SAM-dependent methyltransferase